MTAIVDSPIIIITMKAMSSGLKVDWLAAWFAALALIVGVAVGVGVGWGS